METADDTRSHGITHLYREGVREYIVGHTLVDITNTGVLAQYRKAPPFRDDAGQIINDKPTWDRSRNQQRNWETLLQLVAMIAQPHILKGAAVEEANYADYGFWYEGTGRVWSFIIGGEQTMVFGQGCSRLKDMCHRVPIITGLTESEEFNPSIFDTKDSVNLTFEQLEESPDRACSSERV